MPNWRSVRSLGPPRCSQKREQYSKQTREQVNVLPTAVLGEELLALGTVRPPLTGRRAPGQVRQQPGTGGLQAGQVRSE